MPARRPPAGVAYLHHDDAARRAARCSPSWRRLSAPPMAPMHRRCIGVALATHCRGPQIGRGWDEDKS
eukprot:8650830-Pyramimonas_sp.AAC.1